MVLGPPQVWNNERACLYGRLFTAGRAGTPGLPARCRAAAGDHRRKLNHFVAGSIPETRYPCGFNLPKNEIYGVLAHVSIP